MCIPLAVFGCFIITFDFQKKIGKSFLAQNSNTVLRTNEHVLLLSSSDCQKLRHIKTKVHTAPRLNCDSRTGKNLGGSSVGMGRWWDPSPICHRFSYAPYVEHFSICITVFGSFQLAFFSSTAPYSWLLFYLSFMALINTIALKIRGDNNNEENEKLNVGCRVK